MMHLFMKGHPMWVYKALISHCNIISYSYTLLFNIYPLWIITCCPTYIGYLPGEPAWFTTVVSELRLDPNFGHK
jgi:hypothetical protein